jgi:hypothetical protein
MICFFDTLYFAGSVTRLRLLLGKCLCFLKAGGALVIFWSRNPMDDAPEPEADNTQVGRWGMDNKLSMKTFDLTESNKAFWRNAMAETMKMGSALRKELPETYRQVLDECINAERNAEGIFRWLYIFTKQ